MRQFLHTICRILGGNFTDNLQLTNTDIYNDLYIKCRSDFNNHIIPLIKKDHCECCGATDNLELHHDKQFIELLDQTFNDLDLDINNLTESDIKNIRLHMLGLQVKIKYKTLCQHCHDIEHQKNVISMSKVKVDPLAKTMARKADDGKELTNAQKFLNFVNSQTTGTELKKSDIQQATGLTDNQYKEVKRNPAVKNWINTHKSGRKFIV